tara:strand:+ start:158 stop:1585 length:1428 start_codon:yes stop_codon:yes gene_type:complete
MNGWSGANKNDLRYRLVFGSGRKCKQECGFCTMSPDVRAIVNEFAIQGLPTESFLLNLQTDVRLGNVDILNLALDPWAGWGRKFLECGFEESLLGFSSRVGNLGAVERLITVGISVEEISCALLIAVECGNLAIVKNLIRAGAVIDGGRPLFVAALYGQLRVVQFLITFVCDVDSVDSEGRSALYFASKSGHKDIVKFLCGGGNCDVNKADCDGSTALHVAAYFGHLPVVEELIGAGADLDTGATDEDTPMAAAMWAENIDIVESIMFAGGDISELSAPFIFTAAAEGNVNIVRMMIESGVDVNKGEVVDNSSALLYAAQNGHISVVEYLIQNGAEINKVTTDDGTSALFAAVSAGYVCIAKLLLDCGAHVNHRTMDDGSTAMYAAAHAGHLHIGKMLIQAGAQINARTQNGGGTALFVAAENGHFAFVSQLILAGADMNILAGCGSSPLHISVLNGFPRITALLLNSGADIFLL